jgi:Pectate lyase superfamily protein
MPTALILPNGKNYFSDASGNPLSGGKLETYAAGTSTPKATYSDAAGTVPNANPVIMDARGEALIYWDGNYKVILKDSAGVTIWTVDNVQSGITALSASSGSSLVNFLQAGTGADARTVQSKLRDTISVKDFGATGDGATNDATAIQEALTAGGALANGAEVIMPVGTYVCGATGLTVPAKVRLVLSGARMTSSAVNAVTLVVGNDGASGAITGHGYGSMIDHTGTGSGVLADGIASQADVAVSDIWIKGTSAGVAAVTFSRFNQGTLRNVKMTGYTAGDGFRSVGANSIKIFAPEISTCLNGMHNLTTTTGGAKSSNTNIVFGGQIISCTGWGWLEDPSGGGGRNLGNAAIGVTFESNGTNASATSGDIFNQNCDMFGAINCYFENGSGIVPTNCIINGDATNAPKGMRLVGNLFTNTNTNTINDVNGQTVIIEGNVQNGANTNFMQHGTLARGLLLGLNRAASTNYFAGSDTGADSIIIGGAAVAVNQQGPSANGYAFVQLSGYGADLGIRTRAGGTNATAWLSAAGAAIAQMADTGDLNVITSYKVAGTKVVGARGAALPADATDLATAITLVNAIKARMVAHGLVA